MRVVHLNTFESTGGAARAVQRISLGLQRIDVDSSVYVRRSQDGSSKKSVCVFSPPRSPKARLQRFVRRKVLNYTFRRHQLSEAPGWGPFSDDRTQFGDQVLQQIPTADIYNLHWIRDFVDLNAFFQNVSQPIVWTMHDMNPFTGGCHVDRGCGRYKEACGQCPYLGSSQERDLSRKIWERKKNIYQQIDPDQFCIVASSQQMVEQVKRSSLLGRFDVHRIPLALDTSVFAPRPSKALRATLGIPQSTRVLLFVAVNSENPNKGFDVLDRALEAMGRDIFLVSVGNGAPTLNADLSHVHLGSIENDCLLSLVYSVADVFVNPARQEAFSQTSMEALACGVPVIGSNTGGIPEIVRSGETGLLVPPGNASALRDAILELTSDDERRAEMARRCRRTALNRYSLEIQARRYANLYDRMLSEAPIKASVTTPVSA